MSGNFAILQAKIGLKKAELGKVENNSNFVTQNWSKLQGAPGAPFGQIRCSKQPEVMVLSGPEGCQSKFWKSMTDLFTSVLRY